MSTAVSMHRHTRLALAAVALCDVGVGMILIGTVGLGSEAALVRDVIGWVLIAHAVPALAQALAGRLHRFGEEGLLVNVGLLAFAVYQIFATDNAAQVVATIGQATLVLSAAVATTLLWAQLSGYRLARNPEKLRRPRRRKPKAPTPAPTAPDQTPEGVESPADTHTPTTLHQDTP